MSPKSKQLEEAAQKVLRGIAEGGRGEFSSLNGRVFYAASNDRETENRLEEVGRFLERKGALIRAVSPLPSHYPEAWELSGTWDIVMERLEGNRIRWVKDHFRDGLAIATFLAVLGTFLVALVGLLLLKVL